MASSISAGTTSSTALVATADTSGALVLQTNNGTTALTLSTAQNATFAGTLATVAQGIAKASLPTGSVLQVVNVQSGAVATTTTLLPGDDTIPQITEGAEFLTLAITPILSTSKLRIDAIIFLNHSVATAGLVGALFRDSTADALAVASNQNPNSGGQMPLCITHYATSGTTSSTTFRVRGGSGDAGTVTFNGNSSGSRKFGGAYGSNITITEIAA
jgi:hypothetical protein